MTILTANNFIKFQIFTFLNSVGIRCVLMCISLWLLKQNSSVTELGSVLISFEIASIIARLTLGTLGDFFSKKLLIAYSNMLSALIFFFILIAAFGSQINVLNICFLFFLEGSLEGLRDPILNSILPDIVNKKDINKAIKYRETVKAINSLSAPAIAGFMIYLIGYQYTFLFSSFIFVLSSLLFFTLKFPQMSKKIFSSRIIFLQLSNLSSIKCILIVPLERFNMIVSMILNFIYLPFLMIYVPLFVTQNTLQEWKLGVLESSFGLGLIFGSLLLRQNYYDKYKLTLGSLTLIFFSFSFFLVNSNNYYIMLLSLFIGGVGLVLYNITISSIRYTGIPENFRSRFFGAVGFLCTVTIPLGFKSLTISLNYFHINSILIFVSIFLLLLLIFSYFMLDPKLFSRERHQDNFYLSEWPHAFPKNIN